MSVRWKLKTQICPFSSSLLLPNRFNLDKRFEYKCSWKILCIALIFLSIILTVLLAYFASKYIWFWLCLPPLSSPCFSHYPTKWWKILTPPTLCHKQRQNIVIISPTKAARNASHENDVILMDKQISWDFAFSYIPNRWEIIQELIIYLELLFLLWDFDIWLSLLGRSP